MKKLTLSLAAIFAMGTFAVAGGDIAPVIEVAQPVVTANDFYVGGSITASQVYVNGQSDWFNDTVDAETGYGLGIVAGYTFYRADAFSASIEGRANGTLWEFGEDADDADILSYSALIKPQYNVTPEIGLYGLAGYGASKLTVGDESIRENGFVYGAGVEYAFTDAVAVTLDYVVNPAFTEDGFEDVENDTISLGVNYRF